MDTHEFKALQLTLKELFSNHLPANVRFYSCQISKSINLLDCEKKIVKNAIPKRVYEFSAGRMCARKSLSFFGVENFPILQGKLGEPLWPENITGSISHHSGMAFAVSMPLNQGYIGIDIVDLAENLPDPSAVFSDIESTAEFGENLKNRELLLFSLKESVIKILSPLLQEYVEFKDIEIIFDNNVGKVNFRTEYMNIKLFWLSHGHYAITLAIMKN